MPSATYRLQFHRDFPFDDARRVVPYLAELGVTHVYASPIFTAIEGSRHGYDVADPTSLNPELGTEADFLRLVESLKQRGMGLIIDIVPNHMAAHTQNSRWRGVLEHGRASHFASCFDIDWGNSGRIVLPVLGAPLTDCLAAGEVALTVDSAGIGAVYAGQRYPLDPATYAMVLESALGRASGRTASVLQRLIDKSGSIPRRDATDRAALRLRKRRSADLKDALAAALRDHTRLRSTVCATIDAGALGRVLDSQGYRLEFWRRGIELLNYRRFFDITGLVGVRVEDTAVFDETHSLVRRLVRSGAVSGLRVDHIDGLRDPAGYLASLRSVATRSEPYVVVEKILSHSEQLRSSWPVAGTTGYDFLDLVNRLFVSPDGFRALQNAWASATGTRDAFDEVVYREKKRVISTLFRHELQRLSQQLWRVIMAAKLGRGLSQRALRVALVDVTARLPVYRTYARGRRLSPGDRRIIEAAVLKAARSRRRARRRAVSALGRVLTFDVPGAVDPATMDEWGNFVQRWQQFSGPVMAKGQEDTAFYVYRPLISLNEVGSHPVDPAGAVSAFHRRNAEAARLWPATMNATSTHDTKRSGDVRSRINVLSGIHGDWLDALRRWRRMNAPLRQRVGDAKVPDGDQEIAFYQTLIGSWPLTGRVTKEYRSRLKAYIVKAAREAKVHTSWLDPDPRHERALTEFVGGCLDRAHPFADEVAAFTSTTSYFGAINSLAQTALKITSPGVPDVYQGTETWDFSLVDPDNRRPIDFRVLRGALRTLKGGASARRARHLFRGWRDGRIKTYVIMHTLRLRRARPHLFRRGRYIPLRAAGPRAENIIAFARVEDREWCITIVPRLIATVSGETAAPIGDFWDGTSVVLPRTAPKRFTNALTAAQVVGSAGEIPLAQCLRDLPIAIMIAFEEDCS